MGSVCSAMDQNNAKPAESGGIPPIQLAQIPTDLILPPIVKDHSMIQTLQWMHPTAELATLDAHALDPQAFAMRV
jgi:hypothetical protein